MGGRRRRRLGRPRTERVWRSRPHRLPRCLSAHAARLPHRPLRQERAAEGSHRHAARTDSVLERLPGNSMNRERITGDEGGFVLVWMAIMLFVLIGLAGLAVDLGNWYFTANREQKAADAGALGGAVLLPGDPHGAVSTAVATVATNGYARPTDVVSSDQDGLLPTQLRVTITHKVDN